MCLAKRKIWVDSYIAEQVFLFFSDVKGGNVHPCIQVRRTFETQGLFGGTMVDVCLRSSEKVTVTS